MVADPAAARNRFCVQGMLDTGGMFRALILTSLIGVVLARSSEGQVPDG
jgi:hypothetical protein